MIIFFFNHFVSEENKFVIVGGRGLRDYIYSISLSSVEVLDENQHLTCNIPSYPMELIEHSSTVTTSGILVCGGSSGRMRKDCYEYRSSSNSWIRMPSMTTERGLFDMIYMNGKIYAVGGSGGSGSLNSVEIFDPAARTWTKQSIPFSIYSHCITQLSANQFILIGGINGTGYEGGVSKNVITKNISIQKLHFLLITTQSIFIH